MHETPFSLNDLYRRAVLGTPWLLLQFVVTRVAQFAIMLILARLLLPSDLGVVALSSLVLAILGIFADLGTATALIQRQDRVDAAADWVFLFNVGLGAFWYGIVWSLAPWVALFFHEPRLELVLRLMGVSVFVVAVAVVPQAFVVRQLRVRTRLFIDIGGLAGNGVTSIALAVAGWGLWALVAGSVVGPLVQTLGFWRAAAWRPRWPRRDRTLVRSIGGFGSAVSGQAGLVWIVNSVDNLLIGRWWKAADVGLYDLGVRVGTFPSTITTAASSIIYPLFCRLQGDRPRLQQAYLKVVELMSFVTFPIGVGIAASAPLVIPWLFGPQWSSAVGVVQAVSMYGVMASVGGVMAPLCNALGRPRTLLWYLAFAAATAVPAYLIAVPYGISAVAVSHLILVCLRFPLDVMIPSRLLGLSTRDFWRSVRTPALASLVMGAVVVAMTVTLPHWFGFDDSVNVVLLITVAITVYVLLVRTQGLLTLTAVARLIQHPTELPRISLGVS